MYLHYFTRDRPRDWGRWFLWVEYCYNTSYHSALQTTPFRLVYVSDPSRLLTYVSASSRSQTIDIELSTRDQILAMARERLLQDQACKETAYNEEHRELFISPEDWVWLKRRPYRQMTIA